MTKRAVVKQATIARALRAVQQVGGGQIIKIEPDGSITVLPLQRSEDVMTPERIKELRAIMDGTSDVFRNAAPRTIKAMIPIVATQSLPQALDTIEAQAALIAKYHAEQSYSYIGKDGKSIKARDLEDQRDELAARSEAQQRRIEELEAALKPFADVAESDIGNDETDEDTFRPMSSQKVAISPLLIVGNLRTARAALQPKEPS